MNKPPEKPIKPDIVIIREGCTSPIKIYSPIGHDCKYKRLCTKLSQLNLPDFKTGDYTTAVDVLIYLKSEIENVMESKR